MIHTIRLYSVDITKRAHVDIPDVDGRIDPQVYSNWLATLKKYFDWYETSDGRIVRFAIMKVEDKPKFGGLVWKINFETRDITSLIGGR